MLAWLVLAACVVPAEAAETFRGEHKSELLDSSSGLPATSSWGVAQDDRGWLWVTTSEGIARMDGARTVRVTGAQTRLVYGSGARNRIVVYDSDQRLVDLVAGELRPLRPERVDDANVDDEGRVWAIVGGAMVREEKSGGWSAAPGTWSAETRLLGPVRGSGVFAESGDDVYRVTAQSADLVGRVPGALSAADRADGSVVVLANSHLETNDGGTLVAYQGGVARTLYTTPLRAIGFAVSGNDLYVNYDRETVQLDASDRADLLSPTANCCGGILADREGGVWVATTDGLRHYPSPKSVTFPVDAIRGAAGVDGVWVSSWAGFRHMAPDGTSTLGHAAAIAPCVDASGSTWGITPRTLTRVHAEGPSEVFGGIALDGTFSGCARGVDGRTWFGSATDLLVSDATDPIPRPVAKSPPIPDPDGPGGIRLLEHDGQLLAANRRTICRSAVDRVLQGDPSWTCIDTPAPGPVVDLEETTGGELWAAVTGVGVLRAASAEGPWNPIPASTSLRTATLGQLTPSPRGGIWVLAEGDVIRVADESGGSDGWSVLERLGTAQGVQLGATATDLVEAQDGDLWIVAIGGAVTYVPAPARTLAPDAPEVFISAVTTDDGEQSTTAPLVLDHERSALQIQFASAVFGQRSLLQYRYRLDGHEWSAPTRDASLQFAALGTGRYTVEVEASLDGRRWSTSPASYAFRVRAPWYVQPWFLLSVAAVVATLAFAAHRARLRAALRLEHQRARIARDLHDEIGSGLGSIGLLAGLAVRGDGPSSEMASRIASLATELGTSLTDIVMSLQRGAANLRSLHAHIVDRGAHLCPAGAPRFVADASGSIPAEPVGIAVRINVFFVAVEAIHNAVKHAKADTITFSLRDGPRSEWILTVTDDGCGIPLSGGVPPARARGGLGLRGMRERASEIGATVTWAPGSPRGTVVELRFDPRADRSASDAPLSPNLGSGPAPRIGAG